LLSLIFKRSLNKITNQNNSRVTFLHYSKSDLYEAVSTQIPIMFVVPLMCTLVTLTVHRQLTIFSKTFSSFIAKFHRVYVCWPVKSVSLHSQGKWVSERKHLLQQFSAVYAKVCTSWWQNISVLFSRTRIMSICVNG
jgi:hypothetical protein